MVIGQTPTVISHFGYESIAAIVIVVEMNLHIGNPKAYDLRDPIQQIPTVFFLGIEETVLGGLAIRVTRRVFCNRGPSIPPLGNALHCLMDRRTHSERFEVIGNGYPSAPGLDRSSYPPQSISQVRP